MGKGCNSECNGHGTCSDNDQCVCDQAWRGSRCEVRGCPGENLDCSGHGECNSALQTCTCNPGKCECVGGWEGVCVYECVCECGWVCKRDREREQKCMYEYMCVCVCVCAHVDVCVFVSECVGGCMGVVVGM